MKLRMKKEKYSANTKDILGGFKIIGAEETIDHIVKNKECSITRFGDGEFDMICGVEMNYQEYNPKLAERLRKILVCNEENLLVGINSVIDLEYVENYEEFAKDFWRKWLNKNKFKLLKLLKKSKQYYASSLTRFYLDYKDKTHVGEYVKKLKTIWDNQDVVIVEGEYSRLGVGNDLFDNMKSIQRIICPSENAYNYYEKILEEVLKISKDKTIMIALGPTATVLAYDLHKMGYRAIDIGHVDIEYEWYLRKATTKIKIEHKYVTEVTDGRENIQDVNDLKYNKEIITIIK